MENIKCSKVASPSGIDNFEHKETVKADTYTLTLIVEKLEKQLQSYKDKEDKLREYIESYCFDDNFVSISVMKHCRNQIEEILNEGSDL